jgi:hypothetical protein
LKGYLDRRIGDANALCVSNCNVAWRGVSQIFAAPVGSI